MTRRESIWALLATGIAATNPFKSAYAQMNHIDHTDGFDPVIRKATLQTRDAERLSRFYQKHLGLRISQSTTHAPRLDLANASNEVILSIKEDSSAQSKSPGTPGLFHIAYAVDTQEAWKKLVNTLKVSGIFCHGIQDHGVSLAAYYSDPDGNGVEICWDKPVAQWPMRGEDVRMYSQSITVEPLTVKESEIIAPSHIGHVHLSLGSLNPAAEYCDALGMRVRQRDYPGALFMAQGDYHHHFAINTWRTHPSNVRTPNAVGLESVDFTVPNAEPKVWQDSIGINYNINAA